VFELIQAMVLRSCQTNVDRVLSRRGVEWMIREVYFLKRDGPREWETGVLQEVLLGVLRYNICAAE
jgi:hypothetical protein